MKTRKNLCFVAGAALFSGVMVLAGFFKVSFIFGSQHALFSGINILGPLAGAWGGSFFSVIVLLFGCLLRGMFNPLRYLLHHVPGFCASLYWASSSVFIRLALPLVCMALFIAHPVGGQAFAYSFFWLIPVALYFKNSQHIFLTSLGSTFTAHAVGSVIWLYTGALPVAAAWYALIPVVILERLVFASGMVLVHSAYTACVDAYQRLRIFRHTTS